MKRIVIGVLVTLCCGGAVAGAAATTRVSVRLTEFKVLPAATSAKAGKVTFAVTNRGKLEHELEVIKWSGSPGKIPVRNNRAVFDEDLELGEVEDIEPGETKRFSVRLKAGRYLLLCNEPGHYKSGQYRAFRAN